MSKPIHTPDRFDEMMLIAEPPSEDFEYFQVGLYASSDGSILFGDITVAESSESNPFVSQECNSELRSYGEE